MGVPVVDVISRTFPRMDRLEQAIDGASQGAKFLFVYPEYSDQIIS